MKEEINNIFHNHENMKNEVDVFGSIHLGGPVEVIYTTHDIYLKREEDSSYWYYLRVWEGWDGNILNIALFSEEWDNYGKMPSDMYTKYIQIESVEDWIAVESFAKKFLQIKRDNYKYV